MGTTLAGLATADGTPVYLGEPQVWGAEGEAPLHPLGARLRFRDLPRLLGGNIAEWAGEGTVLVRSRLITLPASLRIALSERGHGELRLKASGLVRGWHLAILLSETTEAAVAGPDGTVQFDIRCQAVPGRVRLRLSNPVSGASLDLYALWPARLSRLIDPEGNLLRENLDISLTRLLGWRGYGPGHHCALVLRLAAKTGQIGFPASKPCNFGSAHEAPSAP